MTNADGLRQRLHGAPITVAPGVADALGALIVEQAGFDTAYLSGASIAYARFGRPDIGLVTMSEALDALSAITERTGLKLIVDADTGFGNALNVQRTVRLFERAGAAAIQIEDQTLPKRCGHLGGKTLVEAAEMVGKIRAALDARHSDDTLIIARTDAIAVEGLDSALARAERYREAGADMLFIEAPQTETELRRIARRFAGRVPLMANMVEGGRTPQKTAAELEELGFSVVIFPGGMVRAVARTMQDYVASLARHGTNQPFRDRMLSFGEINRLVGTPDMLALGARFDAAQFGGDDD